MKTRLFHLTTVAVFVFACFVPARAMNYYVDRNHPRADDRNAGTIDLPWKTIAKANQTLAPGDTVFIKAGTYTTCIAPSRSGDSAALPITYRNYGSDVVTISDTGYGVNLDGKSFIRIQGINFYNLDRFLNIRNRADHNIIASCNFDSARLKDGKTATWAGSVITGSSQHNWIHHCRFSDYGYYTDDDIGCILDIGDEDNKADSTRYNLIEDSRFFHGGHHVMGVYGKYNVIRNNRFHNESWAMGTADSDRGAVLYGNRNLSFSGYKENGGRNLIEGNRVGYSSDPSDNRGASGMSLNSSENIVRFNTFFHNINAGLSMSVTRSYLQSILRNKVYHNTLFNNGHNPEDPTDHSRCGICFAIYSGPLVVSDNVLKNNILYRHRIPFGEYNINTPDRKGIIAVQIRENNWDGDTQGDPKFANADTVFSDPMDDNVPDFRLEPDSPCKDAGTYLTTVTSPDGSGTSFRVADAGYFTDGWGIEHVRGDMIQLFGISQCARIVDVDYDTGTITVDAELSWSRNQGVCLAYEGTAPDIGAFEYTDNDY